MRYSILISAIMGFVAGLASDSLGSANSLRRRVPICKVNKSFGISTFILTRGGTKMKKSQRAPERYFAAILSIAFIVFPSFEALAQSSPPVSALPTVRRPQVCAEQYSPVCGRLAGNNKTYSNKCFADVAGAQFLYDGPCSGGQESPSPN